MFKDLRLFEYDITDSTNTRAREYVSDGGLLPALFIANEQTSGRGRQGKCFYSPKNSGLYMTFAVSWDNAFKEVSLTTAVSVALLRALRNFTHKKLSIKWVNDILADGKKTAGILCETVADKNTNEIKAVLVGIGINLSTKDFPEDIKDTATCLSANIADRKAIADSITEQLEKVLYCESKTSVIKEYRTLSAVIGQDIYFIKNGIRYDATATGIDDNGGLEVEHPDGSKSTLTSGEITLRIK